MSLGSTLDQVEETWRVVNELDGPSGLRSREVAALPGEGTTVRLAVDQEGGRHLLIKVPHNAPFTPDRESRGVQLRRRQLTDGATVGTFADLVCDTHHLFPHFSVICTEVIEYLHEVPVRADRGIRVVLDRWRELLARAPGRLAENTIIGLMAELDLLHQLVELNPSAMDAWTGPDGAVHDFVRGAVSVEVKASVSNSEPAIRVHGERQLLVEDGQLVLTWTRLQRDSAGESVFEVVGRIVDAGVASDAIWLELGRIGVSRELQGELGAYRYKVTERRRYRVDEQFPKITPESFREGVVPAGTSRIDYTVDLARAQPLDDNEWTRVLHHLAGAVDDPA
ncbi:PD-(D/E)XK motif protein [Gemmatimonadota bacterium Y43]|uniref:PD-(D/E)XK motif protein n=1 Tax=Gaopeijia maritima TaxID=3119007 RepID=UPI00326C5F8A